jgi:hypothetical protein
MEALLQIESKIDDTLLEKYCWSLSSLCRGHPQAWAYDIPQAISYFCKIIITKHSNKRVV